MIQHIIITLDNFGTLKYPWLFMVCIHNILFDFHGIILNEMVFKLLYGEILPSLAHVPPIAVIIEVSMYKLISIEN